MNKWNKLLLVALTLQIGLVFLVRSKSATTTVQKRAVLLPGFDVDKVDAIRVFDQTENADDTRNESLVVDLQKVNGEWIVASAFGYPAKQSKIDEFLEQVATLDARRPLVQSANKHANLEVAADQYERKVEIVSGGDTTTLFIGLAAGSNRTALRINDENAVYGVQGFGARTAAATVRPWIEQNYLGLEKGDIAKATFATSSGLITITPFQTKSGTQDWKVTLDDKPIKIGPNQRVDSQHIRTVMNSIRAIKVHKPVANKPGKVLATIVLDLKPAQSANGESSIPPEQLQLEITETDAEGNFFFAKEKSRGAILTESDELSDLVKLSLKNLLAEKQEK